MMKRSNFHVLFSQLAFSNSWTSSTSCCAMALNRNNFTDVFRSVDQMYSPKCKFVTTAKFPLKYRCRRGFGLGKCLMLRGCFSHLDGTGRLVDEGFCRVNVISSYRQLVDDSAVVIQEKMYGEKMDGHAAYEGGRFLQFPDQPEPGKLVVAVDVDEVLGSFLSALNIFIADRYSMIHSVSEYYVYEFCKVWKCSRGEADIRVHEFFKTQYFRTGIHPIPGAHGALLRLSMFCSLLVVTSRQNVIKDHTVEWIEQHFSGLFKEIHFGNHYALDGQSIPKSEICRSLGAHVLIDDNPRYASECAAAGIRVLLFDYENSYPWCKTGSTNLHPLVTKVHNWHEVEQRLLSWVAL